MHRFEIRVRYADTDQMGFAYHGNYLRWFEIGRVELMRSMGCRYRDIEKKGISLPVVEATCRYLKPARYDDLVVIHAAVQHLGRASVRFAYRIENGETHVLLAHGHTEHCFMDGNGRPTRPPEELRKMFERAPRFESPTTTT
jgi:acyl-CoA thioester hydrolase